MRRFKCSLGIVCSSVHNECLAGCEDFPCSDPGRAGARAEPVPGSVLYLPPGPKWDHPQRVNGPPQTGTACLIKAPTSLYINISKCISASVHLRLICLCLLLRKILRPFVWRRSGEDWSSWRWAWRSIWVGPRSSAPTSTTCAARPERPSTPGRPTLNTGWTKVSGRLVLVDRRKTPTGHVRRTDRRGPSQGHPNMLSV